MMVLVLLDRPTYSNVVEQAGIRKLKLMLLAVVPIHIPPPLVVHFLVHLLLSMVIMPSYREVNFKINGLQITVMLTFLSVTILIGMVRTHLKREVAMF